MTELDRYFHSFPALDTTIGSNLADVSSNYSGEEHLLRSKAPRSAKACLSCRSRKVRCDALPRKPKSCTNCTLDGLKCELAPRASLIRRRKGSTASSKNATELQKAQSSPQRDCISVDEPTQPASQLDGEADRIESLPGSQRTANDASMDMWEESLPPIIEEGTGSLVSMPSTAPVASGIDNLDLINLQDFPDADILEQYLNHTDLFDPSLCDMIDLEYRPLSQDPTPSVRDEAYKFQSPLPWVADWSIEDNKNDRGYADVVEQRIFNLPPTSEISFLVQLYFSHAHHRLPVLNERYFHLLTKDSQGDEQGEPLKPISLALLYAIMFFACSYLRTESTDASRIRAVRSMRTEYYSRAAMLFKLGCESDPLRQVQICLLLSLYRNYPGNFYENERWTVKAYRILQKAAIFPPPDHEQGFTGLTRDWKRVCACWLVRFTTSFLGLKWTSSPEVMEAFWYPWHQITLKDFEDDFGFSWHLSAGVKERLMRIFAARIGLHVTIGHLARVLWKRTASEITSAGVVPDFSPPQPSDFLPIEEIEVRFQKWRLDNASLLTTRMPDATPPSEQRLLRAEQLLNRMIYEFAMICLYQNTLFIDRSLITEWAAAILRSSRSALWTSTTALMEILREALDDNLVTLLPVNMLLVAQVPLITYSLYMQKVLVYDPSAIQNLALCSRFAQKMTDLHDGADYYATIMSNILILAEKHRQKQASAAGMAVVPGNASSDQSEAEKMLPMPQLHSMILRFQGLALALGRMPDMEAILQRP